MPSTHSSLHYHVVFATRNREARLSMIGLDRIHEYLGGIVRQLGGVAQGIGGVADHVHLLIALKPTHCLADFVRELKKSASSWIRSMDGHADFRWQEGYAVFSVSASGRAAVQAYIAGQAEHHRRRDFRSELIEILHKSGVAFDDRYVD